MDQRLEYLRRTRLFVLDLDGTFYLGDRVLPGAADFLRIVQETGRDYLFFTNNSSRSPEEYLRRLAGMGCPVPRSRLMTSGDVAVQYLQARYPGKRVYLMGTPALEQHFRESGIRLSEERPEIVVVSFDTTLTYEKLAKACTFIRSGALFLATHMDINCPTETGFIPDCGSFCAAITLSTGKKPKYLGKPCRETVDMILANTGCAREEIAFVGDRLYTDVATGVNNGACGLLVLTGETKASDIPDSDVQPDAVYASLGEMGRLLQAL